MTFFLCCHFLKSRSNSNGYADKINDLEAALKAAVEKCSAERQGRTRAQQALREALNQPHCGEAESKLLKPYAVAQIRVVKSCFSTLNGTPRQPLLVPLARASLIFDLTRVPQASLEGLEGYSHCWVMFVFHLNTNLDKLWKRPSQSKFKAKVKVPRLKGEKIGVFATRSPHRSCPIGLTVAKLILDIKPYQPYCDSIPGTTVPDWMSELLNDSVWLEKYNMNLNPVSTECQEMLDSQIAVLCIAREDKEEDSAVFFLMQEKIVFYRFCDGYFKDLFHLPKKEFYKHDLLRIINASMLINSSRARFLFCLMLEQQIKDQNS